jgi:hypothetical protein
VRISSTTIRTALVVPARRIQPIHGIPEVKRTDLRGSNHRSDSSGSPPALISSHISRRTRISHRDAGARA